MFNSVFKSKFKAAQAIPRINACLIVYSFVRVSILTDLPSSGRLVFVHSKPHSHTHTRHKAFIRNAIEIIGWLKWNNRNWQANQHTLNPARAVELNQSFRQQCISTKKMSSHRCDNSHFHFTKFSILNRSTYLFVQFYCPFIVIRYCSDVLHQMVRVHFSLTQTDIIGSLIF